MRADARSGSRVGVGHAVWQTLRRACGTFVARWTENRPQGAGVASGQSRDQHK